jgi:aryl-alcohol dehydrogenase-like predicted oxidoreductase
MKFSTIDGTDIRVSRIAYGTASLHRLPFATQRQALLAAAVDAGMSHFDTAPYYGYGVAESEIGTFIRGRRGHFTIATKIGLYPYGPSASWIGSVWVRKAIGLVIPRVSLPCVDWTLAAARSSFSQSLARLGTDYVDVLFLHEPCIGLIQVDEFLRWLDTLRRDGAIRGWGVAGEPGRAAPFVAENCALAAIVQTRDSLERREADFLVRHGRELQFTYGYLSTNAPRDIRHSASSIIGAALERNSRGSIIVGSSRIDHLFEASRAVT